MENLAERELPDAHRYDENQTLRVVAEPVTFVSFASLVFDQLRPYVASDRTASMRMTEMIGNLVVEVESKRQRGCSFGTPVRCVANAGSTWPITARSAPSTRFTETCCGCSQTAPSASARKSLAIG